MAILPVEEFSHNLGRRDRRGSCIRVESDKQQNIGKNKMEER